MVFGGGEGGRGLFLFYCVVVFCGSSYGLFQYKGEWHVKQIEGMDCVQKGGCEVWGLFSVLIKGLKCFF